MNVKIQLKVDRGLRLETWKTICITDERNLQDMLYALGKTYPDRNFRIMKNSVIIA